MCKISVIIPVYNTESFIRQCVRSVMEQTYRNLEILVIDDGSTDGSTKICKELRESDSRIQIYSQVHGGVAQTRNYGLDIAKGEYIFFMDSDDAIHPLLLEEMIKQTQVWSTEMVFCNYIRLESREMENMLKNVSVRDNRPCWRIAEGEKAEEWFHITYSRELGGISGLIKKECIGSLRFDESLLTGEDTLFMYRLFCRQQRTAYSPCTWYYYRMRTESISHAVRKTFRSQYFDCNFVIRDSVYSRGYYRFAVKSEEGLTVQIRDYYVACKKQRDKKSCKIIRQIAFREREEFLFQSLRLSVRFLFACCFLCYPVYVPLNKVVCMMLKWKRRLRKIVMLISEF